ncbi:MAG: AAA family ATPase [Burkholderiales bacterium]|nr:AAA family ATPase [Burkholderiales bacterium]
MYYEHFGLSQPPFKITPNTAFFFPGGNRGPILDALVYAITQGEGIIKVTGEVGSGKTMLCRMLEASLPDTVETIYLANPSVEPGEILHAIAFDMHLDIPKDASRQQVMQLLQAYLVQRHAEGKQVVIFVEEAQATPIATLEEIRLLSNLETQHHKLLQIVLFGQPELDEILAEPAIRQLKERITHSFRLDPFNTTDIRAYLDFRMRQAGYKGPDVFSVGAVREIARASIGLTRRVNIIADKALLAAYTEQKHDISARHVFAAAQDSEFTDIVPRKLWGLGLAAIGLLLLGIGIGIALPPLFKSASVPPPAPAPAAAVPATPVPQPTAIAEQAKDIVDTRLAATEQWLANTPPETVGIHVQLLGAGDRKRLENYLAELGKSVDIAQVFVYRTKASGKPAYSVIYGSYPNRAAANAALAQLPAKLQAQRPYLRTVQGMRAEIGAAR